MRSRLLILATALPLLSGLLARPSAARFAQRGREGPGGRSSPPPMAGQSGPQRNEQSNLRGMAGLPPRWIEKLRELPPDQQERFLRNNERFQNLPPWRQEQIRRNLQRWNNLTPEQKQEARSAEAAFERMTPQQRQYVRNTLLPQWRALPRERRQAINRHLAVLRNMSPSTQQAALNDPRFLQGLNENERSMLRELNSLRNPSPTP